MTSARASHPGPDDAGGPDAASVSLLEVRDLTVEFDVAARNWIGSRRKLRAVDGVSFSVARGQTLGLVGESGCGKTTVGRAILGIHHAATGEVVFDGRDVANLTSGERRKYWSRVQMIFQDPYASLDPRMKVEDIIAEPLRAHGETARTQRGRRVRELLTMVGLPGDAANRFPNAFSGGQRQRIGIARSIALGPELVIADEPVSALDVSVQAQVVNLLKDLQDELGLTMVFIAHDLAVVRHIAQRVAVMYLGRIVEIGSREHIFADPLHPYTRSLISAVPIPDPPVERARERIVLSGEVPSPISPPSGCRFHTRCPEAFEPCSTIDPRPLPAGDGLVACHLVHPPELEVQIA